MKKHKRIKRRGDSYLRDALIIFGITLVAGLLMAFVFRITLSPIEERTEKAKLLAYQGVFAEGKSFDTNEDLEAKTNEFQENLKIEGNTSVVIKDIVMAFDEQGEKLGYVVTVTSKEGYGGAISLVFGVDNGRVITGMEVLSMSETPGLGAKITEEEFLGQFKGIPATELTVTKDGKQAENEIDAISGATITTKAAVDAVNAGIAFIDFISGA